MAGTRLLTWNLRGRDAPDLAAVAEVLDGLRPDVVLLQEVQRGQARALAARAGWHHAWRWKHWPVVVRAEGLAVLAPLRPVDVRSVVLAHRWRFWSSRRRIAVVATVAAPTGRLRIADVHLGAGVSEDERVRQATVVARLGVDVVGGDLNAGPASSVLAALRRAGLRDAWAEARPGEPGPTNWRAGPRDGPPEQRIDFVLVRDLDVTTAEVPAFGAEGFARLGALSDHLPLAVTLSGDPARPARDGRRWVPRRRR